MYSSGSPTLQKLLLNTVMCLNCLDWAKIWLLHWVGLLQTCDSSGGLFPHRHHNCEWWLSLPTETCQEKWVCTLQMEGAALHPRWGRDDVGSGIPNQDIIVGFLQAQCSHVVPFLGSCLGTWRLTPSQVLSKSIEST